MPQERVEVYFNQWPAAWHYWTRWLKQFGEAIRWQPLLGKAFVDAKGISQRGTTGQTAYFSVNSG